MWFNYYSTWSLLHAIELYLCFRIFLFDYFLMIYLHSRSDLLIRQPCTSLSSHQKRCTGQQPITVLHIYIKKEIDKKQNFKSTICLFCNGTTSQWVARNYQPFSEPNLWPLAKLNNFCIMRQIFIINFWHYCVTDNYSIILRAKQTNKKLAHIANARSEAVS